MVVSKGHRSNCIPQAELECRSGDLFGAIPVCLSAIFGPMFLLFIRKFIRVPSVMLQRCNLLKVKATSKTNLLGLKTLIFHLSYLATRRQVCQY